MEKTYCIELTQEEVDIIREALEKLYQERRESAGLVKLADKWIAHHVVKEEAK